MGKVECPKCKKKSLTVDIVRLKNGREYVLPMQCRSKKCGHKWEIPVIDWVASRVDQEVKFKPPAKKKGILRDRAVLENRDNSETPYWDVVDLIQFAEEEKPEWMRISYYLKGRNGRLTWGGQTSITEPISVWKGILVHAAREKTWFRDFLKDVMNELRK